MSNIEALKLTLIYDLQILFWFIMLSYLFVSYINVIKEED